MAIEDSGRELWRNHYEGARTALSARLRQPHCADAEIFTLRQSIKNQREIKRERTMPKGGPREGAGRPRGSRGRRTKV
jgi:hypothetical protein